MNHARFSIGQLITHKLFNYRGVIVDIDFQFHGHDDWYDMMVLSQPPKDKPWYHVLVHDSENYTYVSEQNLNPDLSGEPVTHPELDRYFEDYQQGVYVPKVKTS